MVNPKFLNFRYNQMNEASTVNNCTLATPAITVNKRSTVYHRSHTVKQILVTQSAHAWLGI
jgi:hypothetical protein